MAVVLGDLLLTTLGEVVHFLHRLGLHDECNHANEVYGANGAPLTNEVCGGNGANGAPAERIIRPAQ